MNKISSKKLLNSKWTKTEPFNQEKHFIVTEIKFDENANITECLIEALISKRIEKIDWIELKNSNVWIHGWK